MYRSVTDRARRLRKTQTPQEVWEWGKLRASHLRGLKFYRQYVIGSYIVDFCCPEMLVILELDGSGHAELRQEMYDMERDKFLRSRGYRLLRVWNSDWNRDPQAQLQMISEFIFAEMSSPSPGLKAILPPRGGGGKIN